jgi:AraC-like DNA-binding protein
VPYREQAPSSALRPYVACYWTVTATEGLVPAHRVLPDGCMDLLLRVGSDGNVEANVVGTMTCALVSPISPVTGFAGIRFRPGEALAFLDVAAGDARDAVLSPLDAGLVDIDALLETVARNAPSAWAAVLDSWLLSRITRARAADARVRSAVHRLSSSGGNARVARLAAAVGLSERQLERAFGERVGVSPKVLARVLRLQALVACFGRLAASAVVPRVSWAGVAAELGLADQAHLVREVRALAGVTPSMLVEERVSGLFNTAGVSSP